MSLAREDELSLRGYKHKVQASRLQIVEYQKAMKDKDALVAEYNAKLLKMKGDLLDKFKKLIEVDNYFLSKDIGLAISNKL